LRVVLPLVLPSTCLLSIAVLTDYYYNRNKDDVERIVMHSMISSNSYNINAQVKYQPNILIKQEP
jgi:hypothetical protein